MASGTVHRLIRSLRRSSALKDAGILASGAIAGQAVVLALSPFLTRLFTPEQIGQLGVFSASVAILSVVAPLGYDQSVIGATTRRGSLRSIALSVISSTVVCLSLALIVLLIDAAAGTMSWDPVLLLAIAVTGIVAIMVYVSQAWHARERSFGIAGQGAFANMAGRTTLQVAAGSLGMGTTGLLGGEVLGRIGTLLLMDRGRVIRLSLALAVSNWQRLHKQAYDLRTFPLFQMPSSALETMLAWLPLPLVALTYGPELAGLVTLVQRIGTAPASLIGQSIVQIYHQRAALLIQQNRQKLVRQTGLFFIGGIVVFLPAWALIAWIAEPLFHLVFGEQWTGAGVIAAIWAPLVLVQIYGQIVARLLALTGGQYIRLTGLVAATLTLVGTMLAGSQLAWPFLMALAVAIFSMTIIYVAWIAVALVVCHRSATQPTA